MRWRLLAFLPPAAFLAATSLMIASSLVAGLGSRVRWRIVEATPVEWVESDCRRLERRIRAVSRRATGCDADLRCLGSPILCPISMDEAHEREYRRLRRDHDAMCGPGSDPAAAGPSARAAALPARADPICPAISETVDAAAGSRRDAGATFVF